MGLTAQERAVETTVSDDGLSEEGKRPLDTEKQV